jgi:hypothetical protein
MPSTFTPVLNLEKPATGEQDSTWGATLNSDWDKVDARFGATFSVSVAGSADYTITQANATNANITATGILTGNINFIFPAGVGGNWNFFNNTTGAFAVTVKTAGGTGVVVAQTQRAPISSDGVNCYSTLPIGILYESGTTVDIVSTAASTNFFVYSLPANSLGTLRKVRVTFLGDFLNNTGVNQTLQFTGIFGGTSIFDTTAVAISASASRRSIKIIMEIQANGATNAQFSESEILTGGGANGDGGTAVILSSYLHAFASSAEDTTTARNIAITGTLGVASTNLSVRMRGLTIELL